MSRKRKEHPIIKDVKIESVAAEGKSIAKIDDMVIFVPYAVPGDVVDLQITRKKHKYCEARIANLKKKSEIRQDATCCHFGICGGCKWQILPYEEQLKAKQQQIYDQLIRIGKIDLPSISPIKGSAKTYEYRNKLEFGFSNKAWLTQEQIASGERFSLPGAVGFHTSGSFDKILPIDTCYLMDDINNRLRNGIRDYAYQHNLSFYDQREHKGLLRGMMVRLSNTGELMLLIQFCISSEDERAQAMGLLNWIVASFPQVSSLLWVDNQKYNDTFGDLDVHCYYGTDHIYQTMEGLRFKVGPKSFYQTNTDQAYILYKVARDFASLSGQELVFDLYTGTGTIANFVAHEARQVIGIEYVPEAIEDARENSRINGIDNTLFYAGDMKDILNRDFIAKHGRPDVIITDPPRAGMHSDVIDVILFAAPKRVVYVSCNPATQARDLQMLDKDYQVTAVQPVDMFPHTQHVENVVLLERRQEQA